MKAIGQLKHHFWGTYQCTIALQFERAEGVARCVETLGPKWKQTDNGALVGAFLNSDELAAFEAQAKERYALTIRPCGRRDCRHQCKDAAIGSCNHSIDYGPVFEVDVPLAEDKRQAKFAFVEASL